MSETDPKQAWNMPEPSWKASIHLVLCSSIHGISWSRGARYYFDCSLCWHEICRLKNVSNISNMLIMMESYSPISTCALKPRPRKRAQGRAQGRAQDAAIRQPRNQNLEQPCVYYIKRTQSERYQIKMWTGMGIPWTSRTRSWTCAEPADNWLWVNHCVGYLLFFIIAM